jgi:hypothetical protein
MTTDKKFKATTKEKDIPSLGWEGEELSAVADTPLTADEGSGQMIALRFFDFGANPKAFKEHKPTAQELFNYHARDIETRLWRDGLKPFDAVEPRLMFSEDRKHYCFVVASIPVGSFKGTPQTLTEIISAT